MAAPLRIPPTPGNVLAARRWAGIAPRRSLIARRWRLALAAGAMATALGGPLGAGPAPAQETASPPPVRSLHITAPRPANARGEWIGSGDGFLSTTPIVCEATVDPVAGSDLADPGEPHHVPREPDASRVRWQITVYRSGRSAGTLTGAGSPFTFRPADVMPRRGSGPVAIQIIASLAGSPGGPQEGGTADRQASPATAEDQKELRPEETGRQEAGAAILEDQGRAHRQVSSRPVAASYRRPLALSPSSPASATDRVWIRQDEIDQMRQEYVDMPGRQVALAPRSAFIDQASYERAGALSIPWADLNRTRRHEGGSYHFIVFTDALREGLRRWQELLGSRGLAINSGFRNPFKQSFTNARGSGREGAPGSMHQYGRAVDVRASLRRDPKDWVQVAWAALDAGADYVETAPEGGGTHVHADWRHDGHGPALTVKLEIEGWVLDADGDPVPAARVVGSSDAGSGGAGMPAWEGPDADGHFLLRTVWHPGRAYRLRALAEQGSATTLVMVPEGATGLVHLQADLTLTPDPIRIALAHRSFRLASRGGHYRGQYRRRRRRG